MWRVRSLGQVGGVASECPLVLLELVAVDAVNGEGDEYPDCFGAAPGAAKSQREEHVDRCVAGELVVGLPEHGDGVVEAPEVAQRAAVLDQALPQVISVQASGECLLGCVCVGGCPSALDRFGHVSHGGVPSGESRCWRCCGPVAG